MSWLMAEIRADAKRIESGALFLNALAPWKTDVLFCVAFIHGLIITKTWVLTINTKYSDDTKRRGIVQIQYLDIYIF